MRMEIGTGKLQTDFKQMDRADTGLTKGCIDGWMQEILLITGLSSNDGKEKAIPRADGQKILTPRSQRQFC